MKRNLFISIFVCLFAKAFAFDFSAECPSGQTLYYEIISSDDATVRVTYAKEDFANDTYYSGFVEPAGNLEIPSVVEYDGIDYHVVEIGQKAFRFCNGLIGVIIPDGIVTICENAFDNDRSLATVVFGEGLVEIETSAFSQCSNLSGELHFPSSLRKIGDFAFNRCSGLNGSLVFNEGLETIGRYTFQLCDNITSLTIPKSLKELGYVSFNMCDNLKTCYFNAVSCRTSHSFDEDFDLFVIGENVQSITGDNMCSSASVYTFRFLAAVGKAVARLRDPAEVFICPGTEDRVHECLVIFGILKADFVKRIGDVLVRIDGKAAVVESDKAFFDYIVLIPDFADDFLDDVFHRHEAERSAVIVRHDGDALAVMRHRRQKLVDVDALVNEKRFIKQRAKHQRASFSEVTFNESADGKNADDIVDRALEYRQAAVRAALDDRKDVLERIVDVDRDHIDSRRENAFDRQVAELQGR